MTTIAILGLGGRGLCYGLNAKHRDDICFTALCDLDAAKREQLVSILECPDAKLFASDDAFFAAGKLADILFICTQDRDHYGHAMKALEVGYDILLEKPVSPDYRECIEIAQKAEEVGRNVFVCHVLRYSPFYRKIKDVIEEGTLGDLMLMEHNEHIAFWHFAHSYVRGNWRREEDTTPMLMAKCCHDLDLLYWWLGPCKRVSSFGSLHHFRPENAPEGAAAYCKDCPHKESCIYNSEAQYFSVNGQTPRFLWGTYALTTETDPEKIRPIAADGPYGRCVYHCDNTVCDHQTAQLIFDHEGKEVPVLFSVSAFTNACYRNTHIYGAKGELIADDDSETITLHLFGKEPEVLSWKLAENAYGGGHGGGDRGLVNDAIDYLQGKPVPLSRMTPIRESMESHYIAAACEESRKAGGVLIKMHE